MAVNSVSGNSNAPVSPSTTRAPSDNKSANVGSSEVRETARSGAGQYAKAASRAQSGAAEVSISSRAKEMAAANRVVRETPDVREDKVEHFKKLIANGDYKPDAGKIADGIAREAIRDELSQDPEVALS